MARLCTATLQTFLDNWSPLTSAAQCDLYTFTLDSGEVLRYSGYQIAVEAPAPETDSPLIDFQLGPPIDRNSTTVVIGVEVDQLDIEIYASEYDLVTNGGVISWQEAIRGGLFDGAYCELWRCFMSPPRTVIGTLLWFQGRVAKVDAGGTKIHIQVKSLLDLLTVQMPRRTFQAACTHVFGGPMCGFDRTTMAENITATSGTLQSQIHYSGSAPDPSTLFNNGTLVGLTGDNTGYKRTINTIVGGIVYLLEPWIFPVGVGDTFQMLPGCPHTYDACENLFNNADRYGGFRWVPPPENAV